MSISASDVHPLILAGGLGTRLRHIAPDTPKPMILVHGRPFVEWIVRWLSSAGFTTATISTCHRAEQFENHFDRVPVEGMTVNCIREPKQLGTGGAVRFATSHIVVKPSAWLILNGDSLAMCDLHLLLSSFTKDGMIVARTVDDASRYGQLNVSSNDELLSFIEKGTSRSTGGLINGGIYLLHSDLIATINAKVPLSLEIDVLPAWLRHRKSIYILRTTGDFIDIGTEQSLAEGAAFIQRNIEHFA